MRFGSPLIYQAAEDISPARERTCHIGHESFLLREIRRHSRHPHTASRTAFYCEKQREQLAHAQEGNTHLTGDCMAKAPQQHKRPAVGKTTAHKRTAIYAPRERRGTSTARGYNRRWDAFSKSFRGRNPLCEYCSARQLIVAAALTDHDIPHEGDPSLFWDNTFTALCQACHSGPKARVEAQYKSGRISADALLRWVAKQKLLETPHGRQ